MNDLAPLFSAVRLPLLAGPSAKAACLIVQGLGVVAQRNRRGIHHVGIRERAGLAEAVANACERGGIEQSPLLHSRLGC